MNIFFNAFQFYFKYLEGDESKLSHMEKGKYLTTN